MDYQLQDNIALLRLDDGKANAVGHKFLDFVNEGLDRAEAEKAGAVVLYGREGLFSAGFDLKEFQTAEDAGISMVRRGMELAIRLYGLPLPVIAGCTGHAVAMGGFILLSCDTRIGARGDFHITLPETRINMAIPQAMQPLCLARLSPRYMTRAAVQSEIFNADTAVEAGFLDRVVPADDLEGEVLRVAAELAALPGEFYAANKMFMRAETLARMQEELDKAWGALN